MDVRKEGFFKGYKDIQLYYQHWECPTPNIGIVVITHGHGEHSDSYGRVVEVLMQAGYSVYAWDWRGHGRSEGQRGYAADFSEYCYDFEAFLKFLQSKEATAFAQQKVIPLAHSMGGLIQLKTLLTHPHLKFVGQVLCSPFLGLAMKVPAVKHMAALVLKNLLPKVTLASEIPNEALSRDLMVLEEYEKDVLRHDRICSAVYLGSLEAFRFVEERLHKLAIPTLLQIPEQDQISNSAEALRMFAKVQCRKVIKIYPGHKHELYNDLGRDQVFADLVEFLKSLQAKALTP